MLKRDVLIILRADHSFEAVSMVVDKHVDKLVSHFDFLVLYLILLRLFFLEELGFPCVVRMVLLKCFLPLFDSLSELLLVLVHQDSFVFLSFESK